MTAPAMLRTSAGPPAVAPAPEGTGIGTDGRPSGSRSTPFAIDAAASVALALYSLCAALGFARVFGQWQFVGDVMTIIVVGHGVSFVLRRLRLPGVVAVLITLVALIWTVGYLNYPTTFAAGLPTGDTWSIASADLALVRDQFRLAVAPVVYVGGWALLASIGTAFVVFTSDTFAFRAHARGEALVPGAVLFVFVAALGANRLRIPLTLALIGAGFLAAAILRVRATPAPRTLLGRARHPLTIALPAMLVGAALVVVGAWIVGPRLPGATADALVDTRNEGGGVTEVLSPLVDIRSRLVNQSSAELLVVNAAAPAYWRATSLPEFDGDSWQLPDRGLEDVSGDLSTARPGSTENRQEIIVQGLEGSLVPAAAEPVAASGPLLRWNAETSTLVKVDEALEAGDRFEVVSAMPIFSPDELRSSPSAQPPDPIYLELPSDFPAAVRDAAAEVTSGARTTYDAMLTLQNWFRAEFTYSTEVPAGHGASAIEAFLRQRIGYCEQFAGTFAAMARSLGIPARVAVGFTPGLAQPDGSRSVLGKNAHAWPEVWFDRLGWVPFEPTPGRGAPGAEGHTGVPADQDDAPPGPGGAGTDDALPEQEALPPLPLPGAPLPEEEILPPASNTVPVDLPTSGANLGAVLAVLIVIAGALVAPAAVRRWRRRHPAGDAARQVSDLWGRAIGAVRATGVAVDPSLTPIEQAAAAASRLPVAARPLASLAAMATEVTFAPPESLAHFSVPSISAEPGPRRWCRQVERIATDSMTAGGRVRRYFTVWR